MRYLKYLLTLCILTFCSCVYRPYDYSLQYQVGDSIYDENGRITFSSSGSYPICIATTEPPYTLSIDRNDGFEMRMVYRVSEPCTLLNFSYRLRNGR